MIKDPNRKTDPPPAPQRPSRVAVGRTTTPLAGTVAKPNYVDQTPEPEHVRMPRAYVPERPTKIPMVPQLKTPPLDIGVAPTIPAAAHQQPTIKAPAIEFEWPAVSTPTPQSGALPPASQDRADGELAALRRENERLRNLHSLPPDKGAWFKLGYRLAAAAVGVAIVVITALGARLADKLGKVEDKNVVLTERESSTRSKLKSRDQLWNDWADRLVEVMRCNQTKQAELNRRQFPETLRAEPGQWPVYKDSCGEIPERPRELPEPIPEPVTPP